MYHRIACFFTLLNLLGCGAQTTRQSNTSKTSEITSFTCRYPSGFGLSGEAIIIYVRSAGTVTQNTPSSSGGNITTWDMNSDSKNKLDTELESIDIESVKPTYTSLVPATYLDGSIVTLIFNDDKTTVTTAINSTDPSTLPDGISYIYQFCENLLFTKQGVKR